ncbi:hypothetical protein DN402_09640 [Streptomyces sp. SW4]|nr:hypothetical protein DN402_09640 [Streptomyces sp. SW4]
MVVAGFGLRWWMAGVGLGRWWLGRSQVVDGWGRPRAVVAGFGLGRWLGGRAGDDCGDVSLIGLIHRLKRRILFREIVWA